MTTVIYEGLKFDSVFGDHEARHAAEEGHKSATGHHLYYTYWQSRCVDCGWEVSLSIVTGDPFNPNSNSMTRVTVYEAVAS